MNAFNHQYFDEKDFLLIQADLKKEYSLYLNSFEKDNSVQVTFNFHNVIPPHEATIELYSHKIPNYIYIGPYQPTISFAVKDDLFEDSLDSLTISIVDSENRSSYTIEQEKVFEVWKKGKVVNIWFLPFRKYDEETGRDIGYTVSLS
ncbi:hypothetical protein [uncultured Psychrobacter sp.]|uniref:hypothetical protein n=1 Tax=Psychrobacter sp. DM8 TaxID=3440636 RepID=UPI00293D84A4|nr:hypothetical protein [uncultured Psychrobacter sp.]